MATNIFYRWQSRVERGLARLASGKTDSGYATRLEKTAEQLNKLIGLRLNQTRLMNRLGELTLGLGFQLLAIVLFKQSLTIDSGYTSASLNLGRAEMSLANKFLLNAPSSGAVPFNLKNAHQRVSKLLGGLMGEDMRAQATLLLRRIEDRQELYRDHLAGETSSKEVTRILRDEFKQVQTVLNKTIPSVQELEKLEPQRTGFYYREYRERQTKTTR